MTGDGRDGALWSSNYSGADTLMQSPLALDQEEASALELERGSQVDRYTILERLGAGAMGVVYTAYDPKLDRRIALKLMRAKPGVDPASVAARLLREAQALARLSHPNVVTVHDADSLDDLVYLAMELIEGVNLTHWLAAAPRTVREILDVFIKAGRGLAAAHAAGLVHRDFKPDNVLVGRDGRVCVVDFGIARAADAEPLAGVLQRARGPLRIEPLPGHTRTIDAEGDTSERSLETIVDEPLPPAALSHAALNMSEAPAPEEPAWDERFTRTTEPGPPVERAPADDDDDDDDAPEELDPALTARASLSGVARLTQTGALVGTPAYMAPEQHIGVGIDERSDQFSFCVALFEALYRKHPFPHRDFMELSMSVMTGKHAAVPSSSDVPVQLRKAVLRGLSPEPASRHPSMQALLDALLDDPARRRRRLLIGAAAGLGVLALVAGVTASLANTGSRCAGAERHLAGAWGEERREAIERAFLDTDLPYAPKTWETTDEVLDGYARDWTRMRTEACEATHVHGEQSNELLDRRMACLDVQLQRFAALSDLLVEADERVVLNAVEAAESLPPLSECADTRRLMHRPEPPSPAEQAAIDGLEADLARCATLTLAGRYDQAVALARDVEERAEAGGFSRLAANATFRRGAAEESAGKYADAVEHLARAAQLAERVGDDNLRVRIVNNLGIVLGTKLHHLEEAARVLRHAEAILDRIDAHALLRAQVQRSLGLVLSGRGEHEQAIAELRASIDALRASGARETLTASALLSLGVALDRGGAPEEALAVYQEALAIYERRLGDQHPTVASLLNNIAVVHKSRGELDLALAAFQRSLEIRRHALRGDHPAIGQSLENLANVYESMGETEKAIASSEAALAHYRRVLGDDDWRIAGALYNLGVIHHTSGDHERALECYREALARTERIHGRDDPEVAYPLTGLGSVLVELGRMEEAVEPLERALELRTRPGAVPIDLGEIRFALARALLSTRARDEDPRAQAAARARARSLAEASLDDYQASGDERTTARIRRWIARELEGDDASRAP